MKLTSEVIQQDPLYSTGKVKDTKIYKFCIDGSEKEHEDLLRSLNDFIKQEVERNAE